MLTSLLAVVSIYVAGIIVDAAYRLVRISELKIDFESTRSKDVKNECVNLARYHSQGLRAVALWPKHVVLGARSAIIWSRSLESK